MEQKINDKMNEVKEAAEALKAAAAAIASVCDGAFAEDYQGFNKADASFGHYIASIPADDWTPEQCGVVREILRKYHGQLSDHGIDWNALPHVKVSIDVVSRKSALKTFKEQQKKVDADKEEKDYKEGKISKHQFIHLKNRVMVELVNKDLIALSSPYDSNLVAAIRSLPMKKWNGSDKTWHIGTASAKKFMDVIFNQFNVLADDITLKWLNDNSVEKVDQKEESFNIKYEDGKFIVSFPYSAEINNKMKSIPGRRWDGKREVNEIIVSLISIQALYGIATLYNWKISHEAEVVMNTFVETSKKKLQDSVVVDVDFDLAPDFGKKAGLSLRPFQKAGVSYAIKTGKTFIGDDVGLGKTVQALAAVSVKNTFPCLIVCPKAVKLNWRNEIRRWTDNSFMLLNGKSIIGSEDFVIINYDILNKHQDSLIAHGFKSIILDESHFIKNSKAQRSKIVMEIGKKIDMKICLTGTAVMNRPIELVNQLIFLDKINEFGGFWSFVKTFCDAHQTKYGWDMNGSSNLDQLSKMLRSTCYIRREKRDVAPELPELQRSFIPMELNDKSSYKSALSDVIGWMKQNKKDKSVSKNQYLTEALVRIEGLKQIVVKHKLDSAVDWINGWLEESDRKLVVFASHRNVQQELMERLSDWNPARIHGDDKDEVRESNRMKFWDNDSCKVIICSLAAGGTGINLQCASDLAFVEFGWHSAIHDQAEGRIHRIGSKAESINTYWLFADETFDDDIINLIDSKRSVVDAINKGESMVGESVNVVEWFEKIFNL